MARKIRNLDELIGTDPSDSPALEGVYFINNYLNRVFTFEDESTFKFSQSRQLITDPTLIENLTELAKRQSNRIFIEQPEPSPSADESEPT